MPCLFSAGMGSLRDNFINRFEGNFESKMRKDFRNFQTGRKIKWHDDTIKISRIQRFLNLFWAFINQRSNHKKRSRDEIFNFIIQSRRVRTNACLQLGE